MSLRKIKVSIVLAIAILASALLFNLIPRTEATAATFTVTNTNDSGAGSLRQAITDANATSAPDIIEFAIPTSDPNYNATYGFFNIDIQTVLPTITFPLHIDGASQATNIGDTNPGTIGSALPVGNLGATLSPIDKPEIVIRPETGFFVNIGLYTLASSSTTIEGLAIYGFGPSGGSGNSAHGNIRVGAGNVTVRNNVIGTAPIDFASGPAGYTNLANHISGNYFQNLQVENNLFGYSNYAGVALINSAFDQIMNGIVIQENQFIDLGGLNSTNPIEIQNRYQTITASIERNYFSSNKGDPQIDLVGAQTGGIGSIVTVTCNENSIVNSSNTLASPAGIRLWGVQSSTIMNNVITANHSSGVKVVTSLGHATAPTPSYYNRISQNSFGDNDTIAIDNCVNCVSVPANQGITVNDGVYDNTYGNMGLDYPVLSSATLINERWLQIDGSAEPESDVEVYRAVADGDGSDTSASINYGEGVEYLATSTSDLAGDFGGVFDTLGSGLTSSGSISSLTIDSDNNTSEFSNNSTLNTQQAYLGLAKSASSIARTSNNSYNVTYLYTVTNTGDVPAQLTSLVDDLNPINSQVAEMTIVSLTSANLTINNNYNGLNDTELLGADYTLAASASVQLSLTLHITIESSVDLSNSASLAGTALSVIPLADTSHTGTNPDPNSNGNPTEAEESSPTIVSLELIEEPPPEPVPEPEPTPSPAPQPTPEPEPEPEEQLTEEPQVPEAPIVIPPVDDPPVSTPTEGSQLSRLNAQIGEIAEEIYSATLQAAEVWEEERYDIVTVGTVSSVLIAYLLFFINELPALVLRGWLALLTLLGLRRTVPFGVVYDSLDKVPISNAIVRAYDPNRRLVSTNVTQYNGVFNMSLTNGQYDLSVAKPGYNFPSQLIKTPTDGSYQNIYTGGQFTHNSEITVDKAVPIDRSDFDKVEALAKIAKSYLVNGFFVLVKLLTFVGLFFSVFIFLHNRNTQNLVIMLIYTIPVVLILAQRVLKKSYSWGVIRDVEDKPVEGVELMVVEDETDRIIQKVKSDSAGRYRFVVNKGKYRIEAMGMYRIVGGKTKFSARRQHTIIEPNLTVSREFAGNVASPQSMPAAATG
ncbi:MAG: hypothetical protein QY318_00085 [Candidatus Dojkabacteria bacterium]|nr:MAG: hypothetical protein QY318_00085 [Candidatus Dojkabacteria bacterium]